MMKSTPRAIQLVMITALSIGCGGVDPGGDRAGSAGSQATSGSPSAAGTGNGTSGNGAEGGNAGAASAAPLLPWAVGSSWTYEVTSGGMVTLKTTTIGALEKIGGTGLDAALMAYHVTTAKGAGANDHTESWQAPDPANPERILRYREQSFSALSGNLQQEEHWSPPKLRVDSSAAHTIEGASWHETYSETKLVVGMAPTTHDVIDSWSVVADDETLQVPAGTFEHVVHIRKAGDASTKDYWYARGVGKLKEAGTQTEELTEYTLAR